MCGERGGFSPILTPIDGSLLAASTIFVLGGPPRRPQYGMKPPGLRLSRATRRL
jgi:hypothetical protein